MAAVQNVHLAFVRAGDRLKLLYSLEFVFEQTVVIERGAINDLHRTKRAHDVPREPHLAVTATTNATEQQLTSNHQSTTYVSRFGSIDEFGPMLRQEAIRRSLALAMQVVLFIDGAVGLAKMRLAEECCRAPAQMTERRK